MSSGDVGRFDAEGRLYVEGRDDEMIVSGGENVFPKEVEDCLATHPGVAEVAAIGVEDDDFGKRLRAFVVRVPDGEQVTDAGLKDLVKANLARYKVPREIVFLDEPAPQRHRQGAQARDSPPSSRTREARRGRFRLHGDRHRARRPCP
ncbi:hypothetical protein [Nocardioides convexus]|uniref:AMP-binding enzyme n=1 Tax=Nocardioides convexus TaxID=2712224 RepID=UPI0031018DC1